MNILLKYFPNLSETQHSQFLQLKALYQDWNEKINIVSRKDIENLYERHVLHSLSIAKWVAFVPETKVIDIGTGGGLPGIPLAILFPKVHFHLVDSIRKKIQAVEQITNGLDLKNISLSNGRVEKEKGHFDFAVTRAVGNIHKLYNWTKPMIRKGNKSPLSNGLICLKGGDLSEEFAEFRHKAYIHNLSTVFEEPFFETKKLVYVPY